MKYAQVPNMISTKDLDYLSDMFSWYYQAYKEVENSKDNIKDTVILEFINKLGNTYYQNLTMILNILKQGGENG